MSIVTFWGSGKEQVGKTLAVVATATNMAIEHNKKILVISASYNNDTLKNCYWNDEVSKKVSIFKPANGIELDNGIEGLAKIIQSNKITPNSITDYTKVVFKDRLEVLLGFEGHTLSTSEQAAKTYFEIIQVADKYYDLVLVDLDNEINPIGADEILKKSDLVITMSAQKINSIKEIKQKSSSIPNSERILLIGRYDRKSKYTVKNLMRTFGEKREILVLPYNTLYFEAAQEATVTDLFLRLRRLSDKNDENAFFIEQVKKISEEIMGRLQENKLLTK